jgi:diguanylate cyclase (GGDEF)-like protein/PAS domain S-box-containing protein
MRSSYTDWLTGRIVVHPRHWPMRRTYFLVVAAIITLIIALATYAAAREKQHYRERATVATQNMARLLAQNVNDIFDEVDIVLRSFAFDSHERSEQGRLDPAKLTAHLVQLQLLIPEVSSFRILDRQGIVRFGNGYPANVAVDLSDRDFFIRARDDPGAGLIVFGPVFGRISQEWIIVLARRLNSPDGSFAGVVYANIATASFGTILSSVALGSQGAATIRTTELALVHRTSGTNLPVGSRQVSAQLREIVLANSRQGQYIATTALDGIERSNAYHRLERYPFYVIVGLATDDYLGGWQEHVLTLGGLAGLAIVITCLAGLILYRCMRVLADQRTQFHSLIQTLPDLVWLKNPEGVYLACNPEFERYFGAREADIVGKTDDDFVAADLADDFRQKDRAAMVATTPVISAAWVTYASDGRQVMLEKTKTAMRDAQGTLLGVLGIAHDVTARHRMAEQTRQMAYHDPLTQLPNRRLLTDRLVQTMAASKRSSCHGALMFIDLDNFKPINDAHGHEVGDLLLIEVAERLKRCLREMDTVARFGGDEFVVMTPELDRDRAESIVQAGLVAEKIRSALSEPYHLTIHNNEYQAIEHRCTASIGVALFRHLEGQPDEVVNRADAAMYAAKKAGRNQIRFHDTFLSEDG